MAWQLALEISGQRMSCELAEVQVVRPAILAWPSYAIAFRSTDISWFGLFKPKSQAKSCQKLELRGGCGTHG